MPSSLLQVAPGKSQLASTPHLAVMHTCMPCTCITCSSMLLNKLHVEVSFVLAHRPVKLKHNTGTKQMSGARPEASRLPVERA